MTFNACLYVVVFGKATAILLEAEIGVRVSDAVYGIHLTPSELRIRAKNGKWMSRPITPEIRRIIDSDAFKTRLVGDKWYGPKDASVNKYLRRLQEKYCVLYG